MAGASCDRRRASRHEPEAARNHDPDIHRSVKSAVPSTVLDAGRGLAATRGDLETAHGHESISAEMPDDPILPPDPATVEHILVDFRRRVKRERERANLTVPQAAARAGMDPTEWRKIESGRTREPGLRKLLLLQYALQLSSLEELLGLPSGERLRRDAALIAPEGRR